MNSKILVAESVDWCNKNLGGIWQEKTNIKSEVYYSAFMEKFYGNIN